MGEFFGCVYTRGVDHEKVQLVLQDVAKKLRCCLLLAPEIRGWIGMFPSNDQDAKVSREIHRRLEAEVLQVILHDGSVFCYCYYRDGRLADEFSSRPDYFGKVSARKRQSLRGKPEELRGLLCDPADVGDLQALLSSRDPEDPFHAHTILERFAALLGLPNCATSYNYLMGDEGDEDQEIERRDEFLHVPDLSTEKGKRASARAAASIELDRLRREGVLLFSQSPAPFPPCPDPAGKGFVTWEADTWAPERPLVRFGEPWSGGPLATSIVLQRGEDDVSVSPSGRFLVVCGQSGTELREFEGNQRLFVAPRGVPAGFTPDERTLIICGDEIHLISIPGGDVIRSIPVRPSNGLFALHPSGSVLLAAGVTKTLSAVSLSKGKVIKTFFIDNPGDFGPVAQLQLWYVTKRLEEHLLKTARLVSLRTGLPAGETAPVSAEYPHRLRFSQDGRFLCCATDHGAWVYDWEALLASADASPKAVYHLRPAQTPSDWWGFVFGNALEREVFDVAYDPAGNRMLLACGDGVVRQIDLETGRENVLFSIPDSVPVWRLGLSAGGGLLYTIENPDMRKRHMELEALRGGDQRAASVEADEPTTLRIWDYGKLRRA